MVEGLGRLPGFKFWLYHLLAVKVFHPFEPNFLIRQLGITDLPHSGLYGLDASMHIKHLEQCLVPFIPSVHDSLSILLLFYVES